jgi:hypothetical protein
LISTLAIYFFLEGKDDIPWIFTAKIAACQDIPRSAKVIKVSWLGELLFSGLRRIILNGFYLIWFQRVIRLSEIWH